MTPWSMPTFNHLQAQGVDHVLRLFDPFLRGHGRDDRGGREPVGISAKHVRGHDVVGADAATPQIRGQARPLYAIDPLERAEAQGRIDDGVIDAEVQQPLVHQPRDHRGGPIECIAGAEPVVRAAHARPSTLLRGRLEPPIGAALRLDVIVEHALAASGFQVVVEHRHGLEPVRVAVDDRMVKLLVDLC
jgi:hypothetical protein